MLASLTQPQFTLALNGGEDPVKLFSNLLRRLTILAKCKPQQTPVPHVTGKTTILYKFKLNETLPSIPTIGFNVETLTPVKGLTMTVWDMGGQERMRALWRMYLRGTDGKYPYEDSITKTQISFSYCSELGLFTFGLMLFSLCNLPSKLLLSLDFAARFDSPAFLCILSDWRRVSHWHFIGRSILCLCNCPFVDLYRLPFIFAGNRG